MVSPAMITTTIFDDVLREFACVRELPPDLQDLIRESAIPLRFPAGVVAFEEGSVCDAYPMITKGRIRVAKPAANGREIALYRVDPGEVCVLSLNCLMADSTFAARGTIARDCEGIMIPQPVFLRLVNEAAGFRLWVFRTLSERILGLMQLVSEVAFRRLDQRLARILLERASDQPDLVVRRTHQELADELGSVREMISRILGTFADAGLVRLERGQIHVLDTKGLQKCAEEA